MASKSLSEMATRNRIATVLVIVVVSSILILSIVLTPFFVSHEQPSPGISVQNTSFAGLISEVADPAVLPAAPVISTKNGVEMTISPNSQPAIISLDDAEQIGMEFFTQFPYMSNTTLTPDPVWNRLTDEPYYTLRYFVGQYEYYATVNALTGRVMGISPHWSVLMQFNTSLDASDILTTTEIEERAYDFLSQNNYTLSSNAKLVGPTLEPDSILHNFPAFQIGFICVINGCLVQDSSLSLLLDVQTGETIRFSYKWRNVTHIPVENVVTSIQAERTASMHLANELNATGFAIISSRLDFYFLRTYPILKFHLCWVIQLEHERYARIVLDAVDQEIFSVYEFIIWPDAFGLS